MTPLSATPLTGSDQLIVTGPANYAGFSLRETAGAEATVLIYDGTSASGTLLDSIQLGPEESAREYYGAGIRAGAGIFVEVVAGAVEGSVRVA